MPERTSRLALALAILFALQTIGFIALVWRQGTPLGSLLLTSGALSASASTFADRAAAASVGIAAVLMLLGGRRLTLVVGVWAGVCMVSVSVIDALQGGHFGAELAPAAHAVRWATPLVLAALAWPVSGLGALRLLRLAAGLVFIAHGIECLLAHPTFVDFLVTVPQQWLGIAPDQADATRVLLAIGVLDVSVGIGLIVGGWWGVALWMAFWGLLTAAVRVLYFGEHGWPDALIRVTNGGVPLVIGWARWAGAFRR